MHRSSRAGMHLLLFFAVGATAFGAVGAESDADFNAARQAFLKEMKKKSPAARIDAVAAFARHPISETAETLVKRGLADLDPDVRVAVRAALHEAGKDPEAARFLIEEFKRYVKRQSNELMLSGLLGGMLATTDEAGRTEVLQTLDDYLDSPKADLIVPVNLIDDLAQQANSNAVEQIKLLTRVKPFQSQFGYRRCVVQAMSKINEPEAIGFLVEMLPGAQGLVQFEIIEHLTRKTGQKFKDNDREWTNWWKENQSGFQFPSARVANVNDINLDQSTYYGIPICAKRIVFVIDTSVSMNGQPMQAAKVALLKAVESLPESVSFDIVMFDQTATVWQPRLLPATLPAKQQASQSVIARGMKIGTASHAALNSAFGLEPEVIYFLSDGEPTDGQPGQIVESISERNRTRRISIHTIGVVTRRGGGAGLTHFMKPLAEFNWGTFRLVDE